jgi:hypothetical protein
MAISEFSSGTLTASSSFQSIGGTANTNDGVYQLYVDCYNMAKGDTIEIQCLEKAISSGTARIVFSATLANAQYEPMFVSPSLVLMHGWQFQLKQTTGTNRSYPWSVRAIT